MIEILGEGEEDNSGKLKEVKILLDRNENEHANKLDDSAPQVEELQKIFSKYRDESGLGRLRYS